MYAAPYGATVLSYDGLADNAALTGEYNIVPPSQKPLSQPHLPSGCSHVIAYSLVL